MIEYAIATAEMDQIMSRLHRLFDIRITFFDMQEHELEYFHVKSISPFCSMLRRKKDRNTLCTLCDKMHLAEAKQLRDVHIYHCHSGLIEGIVPLYDRRGIYLGAIVFGQLRDPAQNIRPDWSPALKQLYKKLPAYTVEKACDIGHLLKCVSESIRSTANWYATATNRGRKNLKATLKHTCRKKSPPGSLRQLRAAPLLS